MRFLLLLSLASIAQPGADYITIADKALLLGEEDVGIISEQGSQRLPLFGQPVKLLSGSLPFVLTSRAVFALDPASAEITTAQTLDRSYTDALIGPQDRIYLLGGDVLSVLGGSASKINLLYTYSLPALAGRVNLLSTGKLFLTPLEGRKGFVFNPQNKSVSSLALPWEPRRPLFLDDYLIDTDSAGLKIYNPVSDSKGKVELGSKPVVVSFWRNRILAGTDEALYLADPGTLAVLARVPIPGSDHLSSVDSEDFAVVLSGDKLIKVSLPSLAPTDTFNASCEKKASAYPFLGRPLFVCGDKLALPGGQPSTSQYLVSPVRTRENKAYSLQMGAFSSPTSFGPLMEYLAAHGLPYYTIEEQGLTKFRVGYFRTRLQALELIPFLHPYQPWIVAEENTRNLTHSLHDMNRDGRPDAALAWADSVLILTLSQRTWLEVLKGSRLPEPVDSLYFKGKYRLFAELETSGLRELVLPDTSE